MPARQLSQLSQQSIPEGSEYHESAKQARGGDSRAGSNNDGRGAKNNHQQRSNVQQGRRLNVPNNNHQQRSHGQRQQLSGDTLEQQQEQHYHQHAGVRQRNGGNSHHYPNMPQYQHSASNHTQRSHGHSREGYNNYGQYNNSYSYEGSNFNYQ